MPTFNTPDPVAATVQVAGARVRITAGDRTDTVVRVEPVDAGSRRDVTVAGKTKVDFADGKLSVKTTTAGHRDGSVAITIDLPAGSSLVGYLSHSVVRADGGFGDCELHLASGRVDLERVQALRANVAGGAVAVGHVAGRAAIEAGSGDVRIGHAAGGVDLRGAGGGLDIERADGDVTARTSSGPIRIGRLTGGRADLVNGSGDIEVGVGEGVTARVDVASERGAARNLVASGEGPGAVTVYARTRHGDIVVRPAGSQEASVAATS